MENKTIAPPYDQLGFLLMQTSLLKQRIVNAALKKLDITYIQFVILAGILELSEEYKFVTQQLLALERRLDKAMVSNVVKTLIAKDFIRRENHPTDSRSHILLLTEKGKEMAVRGKEITLQVDESFFAGIEKEELRRSLKKILTDNSDKDGEN